MKTSEFRWYCPPFDEYNVAQSAAVPFLDEDVNLVVSFAPAAGKTVLAECAFAYHLKSEQEKRVVYVCPFRSLAVEKHGEWKAGVLGEHGIVMGTGDTDVGVDDFMGARLAVTTMESFDFKTRTDRWRPWVESLSCVVFDEAHLMSDKGRGGAMEASMMRLSASNPGARMILLSGTMSNASTVAKWVKSLNGKPTKCVTSSWKPTQVSVSVEAVDGHDDKVKRAVELARDGAGRKTIVFVHSKITGATIAKVLKAGGIRCAFHNASLALSKRKKIEEAFGDAGSGFDVLVSTSTLGAGVNLS